LTGAEWITRDLLIEHTGGTLNTRELVDTIDSTSAVAEALQALGLIERSGALVRIARV
jgi:hypothetical protein